MPATASPSEEPNGSDDGDRPNFDAERLADARLVELVRLAGRDSPEFRYLSEILRESGMGALCRMGPWRILSELRRRGIRVPMPVPSSFVEELPTLRFLAVNTVLDGFMARQVLEGGWIPQGGASLRTYFTNKALFGFADQYRRYHREEASSAVPFDLGERDDDYQEGVLVRRVDDTESTVINRDLLRRLLADESEHVAQIVRLTSQGYTQKEIAERQGMTEAAVNSALRRFRDRFR